MDKDTCINGILRDMRLAGFVVEGNDEHVRFHLSLVWTAGYEYYRTREVTHNKRKIEYFTKDGKKIAEYNSIMEAAKELKIGRGTVDDILYGKTVGRRVTGHYFRYKEDEDTDRSNVG